jgi:hypothetical protein
MVARLWAATQCAGVMLGVVVELVLALVLVLVLVWWCPVRVMRSPTTGSAPPDTGVGCDLMR